ncbi:hypothetical protein [Brevibacterium sp. S111]|uniref:hypothetical protein n=1 Tax=Brevibacterium sp. S111 TaxID=2483795 RepID=UPI0010804DF1|nr:hypothetical protein [Brevibacterium sp. S111]TGD13812.1 hypothetical protein EB836_02185 [Brevibacterium sp. S111]
MTESENRLLTAEELLASPRGRSLVFTIARQTPEKIERELSADDGPQTDAARAYAEFNETAFIAAYLQDRAQGAAVVMYQGPDTSEPEENSALPADVAEKLGHITPVTPSQDDLGDAMAEVISGAMYWQPPHGADIVAGAPEVRQALIPFAEAILATGLLDDWSRPLDRENQWALAWDDSGIKGVLPAVYSADPENPADLAEVSRDDMVAPFDADSGVVMPQNLEGWLAWMLTAETDYRHDFAKDPFKEVSGEWWSIPPFGLWTSTDSWPKGTPIGVDLVEDDVGLERARACRLKIRTEASICEIHTPDDWADLCRRYPLDVTAQRRHVWFETTGRKGRWVIPDWSQVAEEFDAVHVSLAGYLRTAGAIIDVGDASFIEDTPSRPMAGDTDERTVSLMAGWNPDTTYWLGDVVTGIAEVAEWSYDDDADAWRKVPTR